jgi:hypothetical protein
VFALLSVPFADAGVYACIFAAETGQPGRFMTFIETYLKQSLKHQVFIE